MKLIKNIKIGVLKIKRKVVIFNYLFINNINIFKGIKISLLNISFLNLSTYKQFYYHNHNSFI